MERASKKIQRAHTAAVEGKKEDILPIHTWLVFEQTLSDLNVPQAKCFGEADPQVAALATEWCCPVLSTDSDFYIFDLPGGFLHLNHFSWDKVKADDGGSYIPCQRYTTTLFCNFFHIKPLLLPVFASLAKNWSVFYQFRQLEALLKWLKGFQTTEDTLRQAMKYRARQE